MYLYLRICYLQHWIIRYFYINEENKIWKREENTKRNSRELSSEISLKISKIQFIRVIHILISDKRICDNERSYFFLSIDYYYGEWQNWKENQTSSTAVDRQNVWWKKNNNAVRIGLTPVRGAAATALFSDFFVKTILHLRYDGIAVIDHRYGLKI